MPLSVGFRWLNRGLEPKAGFVNELSKKKKIPNGQIQCQFCTIQYQSGFLKISHSDLQKNAASAPLADDINVGRG